MDGKDLMLSIDEEVLGYAEDMSWDCDTEFESVSQVDYKHMNKESAWDESLVSKKSWSVSSSHVVAATLEDYKKIFDAWVASKPINVAFGEVDEKSSSSKPMGATGTLEEKAQGIQHTGSAFIQKVSGTAAVNDKVKFSIELKGNGPLTCAPKIG